MNLISLNDLQPADVHAIWALAESPMAALTKRAAWSFEGNGIRTRTTFIQAFKELGIAYIELPNLLKTGERVEDLAGYLDAFYDIYVIRESNHQRLAQFAEKSSRPVINAMSSLGHPCEVLTDAYWINKTLGAIQDLHICLWGPTTNVFRSWHQLAVLMGLQVTHVCGKELHDGTPGVNFTDLAKVTADVVITDCWPKDSGRPTSLTTSHLQSMGTPLLLPTPPFTLGQELDFDPLGYPRFAGYEQKSWLLPVQKAIVAHILTK